MADISTTLSSAMQRSLVRANVRRTVDAQLRSLSLDDRREVLVDLLAMYESEASVEPVIVVPAEAPASAVPPAPAAEPVPRTSAVVATTAYEKQPSKSLPPAQSVEAGSRTARVYDLLRERPGISIAELALAIYGPEHDPVAADRVRAMLQSLKEAGQSGHGTCWRVARSRERAPHTSQA
ncbi:MAG: hypothetical protein QM820_54145 [Minicystis sp.]